MNTTQNLLNCPFCGCDPNWTKEALSDGHYYIECSNGECGVEIKADRRDKAIGFWNRRIESPASSTEGETKGLKVSIEILNKHHSILPKALNDSDDGYSKGVTNCINLLYLKLETHGK